MATMLSDLLGCGSAAPIAIAIKVVVIFVLVLLGADAVAEHPIARGQSVRRLQWPAMAHADPFIDGRHSVSVVVVLGVDPQIESRAASTCWAKLPSPLLLTGTIVALPSLSI